MTRAPAPFSFLTKLPYLLVDLTFYLCHSSPSLHLLLFCLKSLPCHKVGGNSSQLLLPVFHCSGILPVAALLKTATAASGSPAENTRRNLVNIRLFTLKGNHSNKQLSTSPDFREARCLGCSSQKRGKHPEKQKRTKPTQPRHSAHLLPAVSHPRQSHFNPR